MAIERQQSTIENYASTALFLGNGLFLLATIVPVAILAPDFVIQSANEKGLQQLAAFGVNNFKIAMYACEAIESVIAFTAGRLAVQMGLVKYNGAEFLATNLIGLAVTAGIVSAALGNPEAVDIARRFSGANATGESSPVAASIVSTDVLTPKICYNPGPSGALVDENGKPLVLNKARRLVYKGNNTFCTQMIR